MTLDEFSRRARTVYEEIPAPYREGIDGLEVLPKIVYHPELEGVYTLGECVSEAYPSEFGGAGEVRSRVLLYYGSFLQVSKEDQEWDWDEEIYETITHEIRHHLEHLASDEALEEMDYAEDQNFARWDGVEFEPFFYRSGEALGEGAYKVGEELFLELPVAGQAAAEKLEVEYDGWRLTFAAPRDLADVHFVEVPEECREGKNPLTVVLLRKQGAWRAFRSAIGTMPLTVGESTAQECTRSRLG